MGEISAIEWTDATVNFWHGCIKVSPGCKNCYMYRDKKRYGQDPMKVVRSKPATFNAPLKWKDPRMVFTCSWSDFFIEKADEWRDDAWDIIRRTPQHTYQILTKRPERILPNIPMDFPQAFQNVQLGISAEDQDYLNIRVEHLKTLLIAQLAPKVIFLSAEPLLGPLDLFYLDDEEQTLRGPAVVVSGGMTPSTPFAAPEGYDDSYPVFDWVIVGGESGPGFRQINPDWARSIRDQCKAAGVPFFMKQMSGLKNKMQPIPEDLQIREMPYAPSR